VDRGGPMASPPLRGDPDGSIRTLDSISDVLVAPRGRSGKARPQPAPPATPASDSSPRSMRLT
jgi:hypothetical protein